MTSLIKNELIKLLAGKKIYAFLGVLVAVQFVPVLITFVTKIKAFDGQTYPLSMLGIAASWLLPIFLVVIIAEIITEEYAMGVLPLSLIHPVSRVKFLAGKALFLLLLIMGILLFTMATAYLTGTIFFGWSQEFLIKGISFTTAQGFTITAGSYLISTVPIFAFGMLVLLLALLLTSSALVVGISTGLLFTFTIAGQVITELQPYLITTYFGNLASIYFFMNDPLALFTALKVISLYGIIPYITGNLVFYRRDFIY